MSPKLRPLEPPPPLNPFRRQSRIFSLPFFINISLEPVLRQKNDFDKKGFSGYAEYFYILSEIFWGVFSGRVVDPPPDRGGGAKKTPSLQGHRTKLESRRKYYFLLDKLFH